MSRTRIYRIAAVAAVIASGLALGGQAVAARQPLEAEKHCVIAVTGVEDGVLVTQPEVCFTSQAEAAAHAASITAEPAGRGHVARSLGTNTIGTHFTASSYSGASVRIVGTTCGGGVWYPTGTWNNNIESSLHHCGRSPTSFYDHSNCVGSPHRIYTAASSLGQMNNRASCVRYG